MRLLIVATTAGTLSRFVLPQVPALTAFGWDVHLAAAPDVLGDVREADVDFHEIPGLVREPNPRSDALALKNAIRLMRNLDPDLVMAGTPKGGLVAMVASRLVGVPVRVYHVRGARWEGATGISRNLLRRAERVSVFCATDTLAVSPSLADLMVSDRICGERPQVLAMGGSKGVDLNAFRPRQMYPKLVQNPRIVYVGRLTPYKGVEVALDVFHGVRREFPGATLDVFGGSDSSAPLPTETAVRLGDDGIHCHGRVSPTVVAEQLRQYDLLVFPSSREGLPNAVIEAAASGVPTVGWKVTGVKDAVKVPDTGELVSYGQVRELTAAALGVLRRDRSSTAGACREWATNFDGDRLVSLLDEYLKNRVAERVSR